MKFYLAVYFIILITITIRQSSSLESYMNCFKKDSHASSFCIIPFYSPTKKLHIHYQELIFLPFHDFHLPTSYVMQKRTRSVSDESFPSLSVYVVYILNSHHFLCKHRRRKLFFELVTNGSYSWDNDDHRETLRCMLMTASDLAASTKPWSVQKRVAELVTAEFFAQVIAQLFPSFQNHCTYFCTKYQMYRLCNMHANRMKIRTNFLFNFPLYCANQLVSQLAVSSVSVCTKMIFISFHAKVQLVLSNNSSPSGCQLLCLFTYFVVLT